MSQRETFSSRLGLLATMVGLAVGLGNVWRFPYMVGQFGGAAFILLYVGIAGLIGAVLPGATLPGLLSQAFVYDGAITATAAGAETIADGVDEERVVLQRLQHLA